MQTNQRFRWVLPAIVWATGIFYLLNPQVDASIKKIWSVLTPLAFVLTIFRIYLLKKDKDSSKN